MDSKILIDWKDEPVISVKVPVKGDSTPSRFQEGNVFELPMSEMEDPRDKLVRLFLDAGPYCVIKDDGKGVYHIHSMNVLGILDYITRAYKGVFRDGSVKLNGVPCDDRDIFEYAMGIVCSMICDVTGLSFGDIKKGVSFDDLVSSLVSSKK